jgi:RNA polymerase sigma-70 factor (ECF subfamily)
VYLTARQVLGSAEEAEDATQEALLRAYRSIWTYGRRGTFASWIGRVAANCAIGQLRAKQREQRRLRGMASTGAEPGHTAGPEEWVAVSQLAERIRRCVGALPAKQRAAVILSHLEDMSLAETAQATGCSAGAIKVQLHRARRALARRLGTWPQQG